MRREAVGRTRTILRANCTLPPAARHRRKPWPGLLLLLAFALPACAADADAGSISPDELQSRLGSADAPVVLDVRSPMEYRSGHIPGAFNIEDRQVPERIQELMRLKDREIVVYCEVGARARWVESYLRQNGFTNVRHLLGDMSGWRAQRRPVE